MTSIGRIKFSDLIDVQALNALMESLCEVIGMGNAVLDVDGTIITGAGWQEACTGFHRVNAETCRRCIESDTSLAKSMTLGADYAVYKCHNGLIDAAAPVNVAGVHVANVFIGQFLTEPPDFEFFRLQARQFGFDESSYLEAISRVPVLTNGRIESVIRLYAQLASMLAVNGLERIKEVAVNEQLKGEIGDRKSAEAKALDFAASLQLMTRRYADAQETERRRLARELHDRVSSSLTAIGFSLGLIERELPEDGIASVRERLSNTAALVQDTMANAREISHDLHPSILEYGGVLPALEDYGERYSGYTGIAVEVTGRDRQIRLPPEIEIALYRIAQEALTNCAKYAAAKTVTIELDGDAEHATFVIYDDGAGFNLSRLSDGENRPGLGLLSMRERAEAIGGKMTLESTPGLGTRITVEI